MKIIILEKKQIRNIIRKMRSLSLRFQLFSAFILLLASCHENPQAGREIPGVGPGSMESSKTTDSAYVADAYVNGLATVAFYDHAFKMITNQQLKDMTEGLMKAHLDVNSRLKKIAEMKNISLPEGIKGEIRDDIFSADNKSGPAFDRAFDEKVIKDHGKAVSLFEEASEKAQDKDIRSFFSEFLPQMEGHLKMAQMMRDSINPKDYSLSK